MTLLRRQAWQGQALPLHLDAPTFHTLLKLQGPSLGLWRAAEIAVLREQVYGESMERASMAPAKSMASASMEQVSILSRAPARGAPTNLRRPILDLGCG